MKQTEELKRSAFTLSVAAESNGMGNVHWRSDEYVTLSGALAVLASYKAELREKMDQMQNLKAYIFRPYELTVYQKGLAISEFNKLLTLLEDNPTEK